MKVWVRQIYIGQNTSRESHRQGHTPIHNAARNNHAEVAKVLIAAGADVNVKDEDGERPLRMALFHDHDEVARVLIAAGAKK